MFNSAIYSLTNLRGFRASTMPQAKHRFGGICRMDWGKNTHTGVETMNFSVISDKNIDSPKLPQPDNC